MRRSRLTREQVIAVLKQSEARPQPHRQLNLCEEAHPTPGRS
jgi:hypothetical protein